MTFSEKLAQRAAARGIQMKAHQTKDMAKHFRIMTLWNETIPLTSVHGEDAIIERHFLESLEALRYLQESPGILLDVGTGNGFPALPLLMMRPNLEGRLLEPATRKRAFLKEVIRETSLVGRVKVLPNRIDTPQDLLGLGPFDTLTMRAVAGIQAVAAGASTALTPGGQAILFIGQSALEDLRKECPTGLQLIKEAPIPGRNASFLAVLQKSPS